MEIDADGPEGGNLILRQTRLIAMAKGRGPAFFFVLVRVSVRS